MEELHCKGTPAQVARRVLAVLAEDPDLLWVTDTDDEYWTQDKIAPLDTWGKGRRITIPDSQECVSIVILRGTWPAIGDVSIERLPNTREIHISAQRSLVMGAIAIEHILDRVLVTADNIWHRTGVDDAHNVQYSLVEDFSRLTPIWERVKADLIRLGLVIEAEPAQAPCDPALQAEGIALLRQMQPILTEVATGVRDLQAGQERILARFDQQEQRILAPILARLNTQQAEQTAAILDALDTRVFPADELGRHLAVIQMALAELNIRATQMGDRQLAESARQVTEFASAPGLDIKHKLKVTIPIVPVLLSYEGAFELGSRLNLEEAWRALRGRITGG